MKILYLLNRFSGGAPRSLLEYIKLAKENNFEVVACGSFHEDPSYYKKHNIKLYNTGRFNIKKPIKNIFSIYELYKIIKKEKPDLIHSIQRANFFGKVISSAVNIPIIYTQAGGRVSKRISRILVDEDVIIFSKENKYEFIKSKKNLNLHLISNRIDIDNFNNDFSIYNNVKFPVKMLLISRLDKGKIKSVLNTINITKKLLMENIDVELTIIGDGSLLDLIKDKSKLINAKFNKKVVNVLGYKENAEDYINESHIVFSKGRGIVESILSNRLAIVISEEKEMSLCTFNNLRDNLIDFNLSGRNIKYKLTFNKLKNLIYKIVNSNVDLNLLQKNREIIRDNYDISKAEKKIIDLYQSKLSEKNDYKIDIMKFLHQYIRIYLIYLLTYSKFPNFFSGN